MSGVLSDQRFNEVKRVYRKMDFIPTRDLVESLVETVQAYKTEFGPLPPEYLGSNNQHSVTLHEIQPGRKIRVIKAIRQHLKVGLTVAKIMTDEVDRTGSLVLASALTWDEAREFGRALESAGATVTVM